MKSKIKTFKPNELLEEYMDAGTKRNQVFKEGYERFFIARLEDLNEIVKPPIPPTRSRMHSILFVTSGKLKMKVGAHSVKIQENECVIIPHRQVFSASLDDYKDITQGTGFNFGFIDDFIIEQIANTELLNTFEFLTVWGNPVIRPHKTIAKYIIQSLNRIFNEYAQNGLQNPLILQAHLIATLCDLKMDYKPLSNSNNKTAVALTNRFKELLHQNIRTKHQVSDYSSLLHVSPNHLNKTVKLITQKSPSVWIGETLVSESKVLLFQSSQSISEIASELGIDDQSYFSRLFKKHEGVTPIAYRKMIDLS
ncbi:helix-turn-helix domain-containing protein [Flavivirga spongiicola]|uniref:AraC family transcriptional regulator n=1 Tax=Flavivirga spongiicola TaxID=421621 RepID=A0ABU7XMD5_9FLAO|nr:AraC family transcriptional regulator [Flavivirga sp. MEBiC05379]MDO5981586.1 AraC family transcriptional regulator [Flavivirga sp. MEBiC05379]